MKKLGLVLAVALGTVVACSLATAQDTGKNKGGGFPSVDDQVEQLQKALDLKDDQLPKVKAVIKERHKANQAARGDTSLSEQQLAEKRKAIMQESIKKMKGVLTEEQFKKYQEMMSKGAEKGGKKKAEKKSE